MLVNIASDFSISKSIHVKNKVIQLVDVNIPACSIFLWAAFQLFVPSLSDKSLGIYRLRESKRDISGLRNR